MPRHAQTQQHPSRNDTVGPGSGAPLYEVTLIQRAALSISKEDGRGPGTQVRPLPADGQRQRTSLEVAEVADIRGHANEDWSFVAIPLEDANAGELHAVVCCRCWALGSGSYPVRTPRTTPGDNAPQGW